MRLILPLFCLTAACLWADPPGAQVPVRVTVPAALATGAWASPKTLLLPPGFQISLWARLDNARFMAVAPNGDVFVSQPGGGAVYVYRPVAGSLPKQFVYITGLRGPHGIAFDTIGSATYVYIAETNQINRFLYIAGDTVSHDRQVIVTGLPDGSVAGLSGYGHPLKNIAIGPDHLIYVGIGSTCNVCSDDPVASPVRGSIYVYKPDGSGGRLFAKGLRNPEGLAFVPGTNTLWAAVNNRDQVPYPYQDSTNQYNRILTTYIDDHPPEPFTRVRDGGNYGWPFCNPTQDGPSGFDRMKFDLDLDMNADGHVDCSKMDIVDRGLQAHSAPLQLVFAQNTALPAVYRNGAIVAFHGSWDRSVPTGYKVVYIPWDTATSTPGVQVDLVAGMRDIGSRPAGLAITKSGSLLISDDSNGAIFELTYTGNTVSGASAYPLIAPESYASLYGLDLGGQALTASPPYPTTLGNVGLQMTDAAGSVFAPALSYVSSSQINFVVPAGIALGTATIRVGVSGTWADQGAVQISDTAPSLFSLDGSGTGTAAAVASDSAGNNVPVFQCAPIGCVAMPIDVTGAVKYLSLYGTGIRRAASGTVQVFLNGIALQPLFVGAQPTFPALDQINVALPSSLAGSGTVEVHLAIGNALSNSVTIAIR